MRLWTKYLWAENNIKHLLNNKQVSIQPVEAAIHWVYLSTNLIINKLLMIMTQISRLLSSKETQKLVRETIHLTCPLLATKSTSQAPVLRLYQAVLTPSEVRI